MKNSLFIALVILTGCGARMGSQSTAANQNTLEEVRIALMDVRQAYQTQQMDLQLLEEKLANLNPPAVPNTKHIEARIRELEKMQEALREDLQKLGSHANQTNESLVHYRNQINNLEKFLKQQGERLNEIIKLRGTLDSISKAIGSGGPSGKTHRVIGGDSLEKIARKYNTSVDELKRVNNLSNNTIIIGQELKLPN